MINKLIEIAVKQKFLIIILLISLSVWGIYSYQKIPIDAFPEVTNNQVQILTKVSGMSPIEVEKLVTYPIELSMVNLPDVIENRSISQFGLSSITIVFKDQVDIYFARQLILERLGDVRDQLPENLETEMAPVTTGLGLIYEYLVTDDPNDNMSYSQRDLRTIQDWIIVPELRSVPGVAEVNSQGGFVKQYQVLLNQPAMLNYNVNLDDVYTAIAESNQNAGGQYIERQDQQFIVRGIGLLGSGNSEVQCLKDLNNTMITSRNGTPIFLRDVASIEIGNAVRYGGALVDSKGETVNGTVMMYMESNVREVLSAVKAKMELIKTILPSGVIVDVYYDRIELVNNAITTVTQSLLIGAVLVIIVLTILIGDLRSSVIVSLTLPFTALLTFILMRMFGFGANLMSLGGLAIGIGMFVDGSIVMVENIFRVKQENPGHSMNSLILRAGHQVGRPIVFAIGVVIAVFLPLFTLQDLEGRMFRPLAFTISFALMAALLLALTMAPALCAILFRKSSREFDASVAEGNALVQIAKKIYEPTLDFVLRHRIAVTLMALIMVVGALLIFTSLGSEFVPRLEEGSISLQVARDPSISLEASLRLENQLLQAAMEFPEISRIVSKVGRAEVALDPNPHYLSDVYIGLKSRKSWRFPNKETLENALRERFDQIPGIAVNFSQPIQQRVDELISGIKSQIAVKIFGPDLNKLEQLGTQVANVLNDIEGAVDVNVQQIAGLGYLQIHIDRENAARYNLSISAVQNIIETAIGGSVATTALEGERRFDVLLRYRESNRSTPNEIRAILINTSSSQKIRLGDISTIQIVEGPAQVNRERGKRLAVVECNVTGRDMGGFVAEAQKTVVTKVHFPSGYFITWGGQFESQQRTQKRLSVIIPITLVIIFLLLYVTFNSIKQAFLVLFNIPLSLVGGILLLWILDLYVSVPALVGFIALLGIAVQNGVVMITFINDLKEKGTETMMAIKSGAMLRLRPILMTSLTTLFGLLPLLVATGLGSDVQRPLAAVVVGGLFTSVVSTLLVLPAIYRWFEAPVRND